jgi:hypothetical protein
MKLRDELETMVSDGPLLVRLLGELGFQVGFRYEKYREEFILNDVIVAVDETPVGTFIEIEGSAEGIRATATALGRSAPATTCSIPTGRCLSSTASGAACPSPTCCSATSRTALTGC